MAGGFKWSLDWDTNPLRKGGKVAADAIENAADVFEDLAKTADRAAENAGDSLADETKTGAKTAARALADLEDRFRDTAREAAQQTKKTGDALGDDVRRGTDEAGDGLKNMKDEAGSTAREVAASFDGSAESIAGGFQEVAANALSGFGPVGAAAGLAAAAGIGLAFSSFQENADNAREVVSDMYDDLLESGEDYLSESYKQEEYWRILKGESKTIELDRLKQIAAYSQMSSEEVALAYAGDAALMERVTEGLIEKRKEFEVQLHDEIDTNDSAARSGIAYIDGMIAANERRTDTIIKTTAEVERGREVFERFGTAAIESAEEARSRFDGLGRTIAEMPDKTVKVTADADTGPAEREMNRLTAREYKITVTPVVGVMKAV